MQFIQNIHSTFRAFIHTLLFPQTIYTNRNTGLLRLIACLCMTADHVGKMFFPQYTVFRMIGRLAFPLFAYGIAVGAASTHNPIRYIERIALLALVSQPIYALALAHENAAMYAVPFAKNPFLSVWTFYINSWEKPSILLTLLLGLCFLLSLREHRFALAVLCYVLCERFSPALDYTVAGIRLILLFYLTLEHPLLCLLTTIPYMIVWSSDGHGYPLFGMDFGMRIYALPAVLLCCIPMRRRLLLQSRFVYGFYPAHLALIALLVKWPF